MIYEHVVSLSHAYAIIIEKTPPQRWQLGIFLSELIHQLPELVVVRQGHRDEVRVLSSVGGWDQDWGLVVSPHCRLIKET